jgi:hypothetical protein
MKRGSCAFKNSPHGPLGHAVRLWSVVSRSVVPVAEFSGRLRQFRRIVRPKDFNSIVRSQEFLHGSFDRFGVLGSSWETIIQPEYLASTPSATLSPLCDWSRLPKLKWSAVIVSPNFVGFGNGINLGSSPFLLCDFF